MEQYFKVSMSNGIHAKRSNTGTDESHAYVNPIVTRQTVMQVGIPCHHFPPCFLPGKVSLLFPKFCSQVECDLSCNNLLPVFNSQLLRLYAELLWCLNWGRIREPIKQTLKQPIYTTFRHDMSIILGWWRYEFPLNLQPGPNFEPLK